jgi:imidazole glycerol-phosphate synthase subunit HisH
MRVTILDYGAGNLHSLEKALTAARANVAIEQDPRRAIATDILVLPGVGAFSTAAEHFAADRDYLRDAITDGLPTLGICLGMQLLFDSSDEGPGRGLGVIRGTVVKIRASRVPHIGWNSVRPVPTEETTSPIETAYFANSFVCRPADESVVIAWSSQDDHRFPAAVRVGKALGLQYHPEKSSRPGLQVIERFLTEAAA